MDADTWKLYLDHKPHVLDSIVINTGWNKQIVPANMAAISTVLSQQADEGRQTSEFDRADADDIITITDSWLSREQCAAAKCVLDGNCYPCIVKLNK